MAIVALALVSCLLSPAPAPAPAPAPPPSESLTTPTAVPPAPAPAPAPAEPSDPTTTTAPAPTSPAPTSPGVAEPEPVGRPPAPDTAAPIQPVEIAFDRIELRDGGIVEGELVEFVPKSHMTITVRGSGDSRTFNWAQVEYVQRVGQDRQPISAGKPTIAQLAAESERIERKKKLGLGLAYGGYAMITPTLVTWAGYAFTQETEWLLASAIMTSVTTGLLTSGAVVFFRARAERKELRKVILSATPTPQGGLVGVLGRF